MFIRFNILTVDKNKKRILHSLKSVNLRPRKAPDVVNILRDAGFIVVKIFGSIAIKKKDAKNIE